MACKDHDELCRQIAGWMEDIAGHARAAEEIAALGEAVIPGLRNYLRAEPQVISQPRCFAVAMLARFNTAAATDALREALSRHPLGHLEPLRAESEYVVKNDVLAALAVRDYPEHDDDIAYGLSERLRVAIDAAARYGVVEASERLLEFLQDDVLAASAMEALAALADTSCPAIVARLDAWCEEAEISSRRRLALVRALRVLHQCRYPVEGNVARHLGHSSHPAVRAAAALWVWSERHEDALIAPLLHGALGFDRGLAGECRAALGAESMAPAHEPLVRALQRGAEPDLYGTLHPLSSEQRDWLRGLVASRGNP
jgi:hypothetical protein